MTDGRHFYLKIQGSIANRFRRNRIGITPDMRVEYTSTQFVCLGYGTDNILTAPVTSVVRTRLHRELRLNCTKNRLGGTFDAVKTRGRTHHEIRVDQGGFEWGDPTERATIASIEG